MPDDLTRSAFDHGPLGTIEAEPALKCALVGWLEWLAYERRAAAHTLDGYSRDVAQFLTFLTAHLGFTPGIQELDGLSAMDFRAWLARQSNEGKSRTTIARHMSTLRTLYKDRKSTRLNSSHITISYAVFFLKNKRKTKKDDEIHNEK